MAVDIDDIGPGARRRGARPVLRLVGRNPLFSNDNGVTETGDETGDAAPDAPGSDGRPPAGRPSRTGPFRRRGPLITRWIGFAARRQRAQERREREA